MRDRTRDCFFHAFVFFMVAAILGIATAMTTGTDTERLWLASHLQVLLTVFLIGFVGVAWKHLALSRRQSELLYFAFVTSNYILVPFTNFLMPALRYPAPIITPDIPMPATWIVVLNYSLLVPALLMTFVGIGLGIWGLRPGSKPTPIEA